MNRSELRIEKKIKNFQKDMLSLDDKRKREKIIKEKISIKSEILRKEFNNSFWNNLNNYKYKQLGLFFSLQILTKSYLIPLTICSTSFYYITKKNFFQNKNKNLE